MGANLYEHVTINIRINTAHELFSVDHTDSSGLKSRDIVSCIFSSFYLPISGH